MDLSLNGIGIVTALGAGIDSLHEGMTGKRKPRIEKQEVTLKTGKVSLSTYIAQCDGLDRFVPASALRRIDRFSRMALLAGYLAVENAGNLLTPNSRVATVFGLGYGALQSMFDFEDSVFDFGDANPSPTIFSRSVTNAIASTVATRLKLDGPSFTITSFERTVSGAFAIAQNLLLSNMADFVLLGLGDEYHPARGYATAIMAELGDGVIQPSEWERCTYVPGEAFTVFLLSRGGTGKGYGSVSPYLRDTASTQDILSGQTSIILDACGEKARSLEYKRLNFAEQPQSYSQLYGSMPTGAAIDLAIAALSWKERKLFRQDGSAKDVSPAGIFCVSALGHHQFHTLWIHE